MKGDGIQAQRIAGSQVGGTEGKKTPAQANALRLPDLIPTTLKANHLTGLIIG